MQAPSVRQFCSYWLPPLLGTAGILTLSGDLGSPAHTRRLFEWLFSWLPFLRWEQMQELQRYLRKAGHILAYGGLYFLWFRAFRAPAAARLRSAVLWSLGLCLATALVDEGRQALVPSRSGCLGDVVLDFGAAALAALALSCKRI